MDSYDNFWDMMKTENGMILAIFISLLLAMNTKDLENFFCTVFCALICAVILGFVILGICPPGLRPYVAIAFIIVAGVSLGYRMFFTDHKSTQGIFQFYVGPSTGPCNGQSYIMIPPDRNKLDCTSTSTLTSINQNKSK